MAGKVLNTGAARFIGFHLAQPMLADGWEVLGFDGMTPYYSPKLKEARLSIPQSHAGFSFETGMLEVPDRAGCNVPAGHHCPLGGPGRRSILD